MVHGGNTYISVGSDHNDRSLGELWTPMLGKVFDSAKTKQMVPALVARDGWLYQDIEDHWDEIILRSFVTFSDQLISYQEFCLGALLDLNHHLQSSPWIAQEGTVLLGGSGAFVPELPVSLFQTQSNLEGVVFPSDFHMEMHDPVLGRTIKHSYEVRSLEEPGSLSL
jgi:hypothetical protein